MAKIEKKGEKVTLEMSWEEYRNLCDSLTAAGNEAWRHSNCDIHSVVDQRFVKLHREIRAWHAQAAWDWTNAIGFPPMLNDEVRQFEVKTEYLFGIPGEGE